MKNTLKHSVLASSNTHWTQNTYKHSLLTSNLNTHWMKNTYKHSLLPSNLIHCLNNKKSKATYTKAKKIKPTCSSKFVVECDMPKTFLS